MKEYSLVILKPDCLKRNLKNEIIKKILELWVEIIANKKLIAREEDLTIHYGDIGGLKEKLNPLKFSQIIEFMKSWEIEIFVLKWNLWMISSIRKKNLKYRTFFSKSLNDKRWLFVWFLWIIWVRKSFFT